MSKLKANAKLAKLNKFANKYLKLVDTNKLTLKTFDINAEVVFSPKDFVFRNYKFKNFVIPYTTSIEMIKNEINFSYHFSLILNELVNENSSNNITFITQNKKLLTESDKTSGYVIQLLLKTNNKGDINV